jgi:ABC-2 type transport system ATP-binding protein
MADNLMIETKGMTKIFGKLVAVDSLNLKVGEGTLHGFVGPNGAGKTTTIKMLVGAIKCTKGEGFIKGYPIGSIEARRLIGYSPERPSFYNDMTASDYLTYMAGLSGLTTNKAEVRTAELLEWLELSKFSDTKIGGFSAGMKQRLSLAQALSHQPELLILDEPTANLDPAGRMSILDKLKGLSREQKTTIFISSHILPELEQLVDSVTLIDKGQAVAEDTMEQLKRGLAQNRYVLNTSNNQATLEVLKTKPSVQEIWLDAEGVIHLISQDATALQKEVMEAVAQNSLLLKYFGEEQVKLEDIYRKTIGLSGD